MVRVPENARTLAWIVAQKLVLLPNYADDGFLRIEDRYAKWLRSHLS